jgi:hypothetical protein
MCRNGTTFGMRVSGRDTLFVGDAPPVEDAMFYQDYGPADGAPDIGDSAVFELVGLGSAAAAGWPAVAGLLGGRVSDVACPTGCCNSAAFCWGRLLLRSRGRRALPIDLDTSAGDGEVTWIAALSN